MATNKIDWFYIIEHKKKLSEKIFSFILKVFNEDGMKKYTSTNKK